MYICMYLQKLKGNQWKKVKCLGNAGPGNSISIVGEKKQANFDLYLTLYIESNWRLIQPNHKP